MSEENGSERDLTLYENGDLTRPMPAEIGPGGIAVPATATPQSVVDDLESDRGDDGTTIEELIDPTASEKPPAGLEILESMIDAPAEAAAQTGPASAAGSYGFDAALAESGKRVPWPKLGKSAVLILAKTQNRAWKQQLAKLRKRYADDTGQMDPTFFTETLLGPLMVMSVFLGMEGVVLDVDTAGNPLPPIEDSRPNRLALFERFEGLKDEVLVYCTNPKNFRANTEATLGN